MQNENFNANEIKKLLETNYLLNKILDTYKNLEKTLNANNEGIKKLTERVEALEKTASSITGKMALAQTQTNINTNIKNINDALASLKIETDKNTKALSALQTAVNEVSVAVGVEKEESEEKKNTPKKATKLNELKKK